MMQRFASAQPRLKGHAMWPEDSYCLNVTKSGWTAANLRGIAVS